MSAADRSKKEKMNVGSSFLNAEQNEILFSLLGHKCTTLVSTMVIVFLHEGGQWMRKHYGVVCFVKDGSKKSYFIRVYSVGEHGLLWEQELEKTLKYKAAHEIFHTVYSKDKKAALCFENEAEAADFKTIVIEKLHLLCPGNSKPASGALPAKFDTLPGRLSPIHKGLLSGPGRPWEYREEVETLLLKMLSSGRLVIGVGKWCNRKGGPRAGGDNHQATKKGPHAPPINPCTRIHATL